MTSGYAIDPALPPAIPRDGRGAVVTVGTFDGVHRGHRDVLRTIVERARAAGRRSILVTFHPHPLRIVRPEAAPQLLTTTAEKKELLAESGVEYAVFLPFTRTLQRYPARRFVEEILLGRLGMRELVIGYDHGFGKDREGGVETMRELGEEHDFGVDVVGAVRMHDDTISSTRIRRALVEGDVIAAAEGLGRPYSLRGPVVHGVGRGRDLGFPTANLQVGDSQKLLPREGIYAVYGWVGGTRVPGLLHLGPRPTFRGYPPSIELHLLDWQGDLYGAEVRVEFCARLRDILPFSSAAELVEQMKQDAVAGRAVFRGEGPPSACADSG
ncbi:MAG TPA: bifunctional riboflavin kinase/FAD synthetase [Longimicrobiaceae bacterium]|nr:bifunctional riboflavin kinase/FAD synthetase [Longimicrobiaceae bacterium]